MKSDPWTANKEEKVSPICDGTRLLLGVIATLGGIVFAGMTSALKSDIERLYRRFILRRKPKPPSKRAAAQDGAPSKILAWLLLVLSLSATLFLGSYVASVPSKTCVNLVISELVCNPPGDDLQGEFITLQNQGSRKVNLNDWTLCDYQNHHCYAFERIALEADSSLTVWTKTGTTSPTDLYFGESQPIWNNTADTAYLYDAKTQLIFQLSCPK